MVSFREHQGIQNYKICLILRYKHGREIKDNKRIRIENLDDRTYRLVIGSVSKDDQATYKVEATNDCGSANSSAELTVKVIQI